VVDREIGTPIPNSSHIAKGEVGMTPPW